MTRSIGNARSSSRSSSSRSSSSGNSSSGNWRGRTSFASALRLLALCVLPLAISACHSVAPMRPIGIDRFSPEKDVLVFQINISEPSTPRGYRDWAQEQLDLVQGEPRNERFPDFPIYEVTYRFRIAREEVAEVTFRRGDEGEGALEHAQTVVRALPEWLIGEDSR